MFKFLKEYLESRDILFKRLVKLTNLPIRRTKTYEFASLITEFQDIQVIIKQAEKWKLFGIYPLWNEKVYMTTGFVISKDKTFQKYHICETDKLIEIKTFTQGKEHLSKLLKEYKELKNKLKLIQLQEDF